MWYQFGSEDCYLLIHACRARIASLKLAMVRQDHPIRGLARVHAEQDIADMERMIELLHDGGVQEVK